MYLISTKEFGISEQYFHIFRGVNGSKKLSFEQIAFVRISYGSLVNNPSATLILGFAFLIASVLTIDYLTSINGFEFSDFFLNGKTGGAILGLILCSFFMSAWVIYQVVKSRIILTVHHFDGSINKFKLQDIINEQRLTELLKILSLYFKPHQLKLNKKINQKYA